MKTYLSQLTIFAVLSSTLCSAAPPPDFTTEFRKHAVAVKADTEAVDGIWRTARNALASVQKDRNTPQLIRLKLARAVSGSDLHVQARYDGYRTLGMAWAPGWNKALHRASVLGLSEKGNNLSCTVRILFLPDGSDPFNDSPVSVDYKVSGFLGSAGLDGRYSTSGSTGEESTIPTCQGRTTGTLVRDLATEALPVANPLTEALDGQNIHELYSAACWYQTHAAQMYLTYRAMCVAGSREMTYGKALANTSFYIPSYGVFRQAKRQPKKKEQPKGPPKDVIIDDDLGLGGLDDDVAGPPRTKPKRTAAAASQVSPFAGERLRTMEEIAAYVRRIRTAMETFEKAGRRDAPHARGGEKTDDPFFGPWFGSDPLPTEGNRANVLPPNAGPDGQQDWPYLGGWRTVGPFPTDSWSVNLALLPESFGTLDTEYTTRSPEEWQGKFAADPIVTWTSRVEEAGVGTVNAGGIARSIAYAATDIHSPADTELWMAAGVHDLAKVWINDRLVATSPAEPDPNRHEQTFLFRAALHKGRNRITIRCDGNDGKIHFWARACTRGKPRSASEAQAYAAAVARMRQQIEASTPGITGFRRDGTAHYPDATPVTAWDIEKKINILWRTEMEHWSKGAPLVIGDRLYTTIDPHFLVCMDKMTGSILWTQEANALEAVDKELFEQSKKLWADYEVARAAGGREAYNKRRAWQSFVLKNAKSPPPCPWDGSPSGPWVGYAFPTPVTDGKHIWVRFGTGATACFDLDGNKEWIVHTQYQVGGNVALCSSPIIVGEPAAGTGRLVVQVASVDSRNENRNGPDAVVAYDALTGKIVWQARTVKPAGSSTPVAMQLTNGDRVIDVVVTQGGTVIRGEDGKILVRNSLGFGSNPTPIGSRFVRLGWKYGAGTATELIMLDRDTVGCRYVWTASPMANATGWAYHNNHLYALAGSQFGGPYVVLDAATGRQVERHVNTGRYNAGVWGDNGKTDSYVPTTIAGNYVFMATRGDRERKRPWAHFTVAQLDPQGRFIAHNRMEVALQSHPAYDGDRMYVRNEKYMTCIAHTGDTGRAYEAEQNAVWLFEDLDPVRPADMDLIKPAPDATLRGAGIRFREDRGFCPELTGNIENWVYAGPFPVDAANGVLAALGGPEKGRLKTGQAVSAVGSAQKARGFDKGDRAKFMSATAVRGSTFDLAALVDGKPPAAGFLYTTVGWGNGHTFRLVQPRSDVDIWIGGVKVKHRDRITFKPGNYPVLVRFSVTNPEADNGLRISFADSEDYDTELKRWRDGIRLSRDIFERIIKYKPDSDLAKKAKMCLANL